MQIEKSFKGDLLELVVRGALDNDSSNHFREEIESSAREGWHRILVDMSGVTFLSSAGMAALLAAKQQMDRLNGLFGIHNVTPHVEQVLNLTRLLDRLRCDPLAAQKSEASGPATLSLSSSTRFACAEEIELEIYALREPQPLRCQVVGGPQTLADATKQSRRTWKITFGPRTFGLGLGALGDQDLSSKLRYGELLSVAGAVAQSPRLNGGFPDYLLAAGDFVPSVQMLYGVKCEGDFPYLIRFQPSEPDTPVGLSKLVRNCLNQTNLRVAGFVILADCAGLIGAQLRQLPENTGAVETNLFALPGVREWLSYSAEQIHRHNLVLLAGIATSQPVESSSPLCSLMRPMEEDGEVTGHFHAAVFPYRPLKKRTLPLESSVRDLFASGSIEDVLHLLRDDRPITGLGESELLNGACWVGPIERISGAEENA